MSATNGNGTGNGTELYELIQRLLRLYEAGYAFRVRIEHMRREAMEAERRFHEEEDKIRHEGAATLKAIREKLGVPEPSSSEAGAETPAAVFDLGDFFAQFGKKPNESPLK